MFTKTHSSTVHQGLICHGFLAPHLTERRRQEPLKKCLNFFRTRAYLQSLLTQTANLQTHSTPSSSRLYVLSDICKISYTCRAARILRHANNSPNAPLWHALLQAISRAVNSALGVAAHWSVIASAPEVPSAVNCMYHRRGRKNAS